MKFTIMKLKLCYPLFSVFLHSLYLHQAFHNIKVFFSFFVRCPFENPFLYYICNAFISRKNTIRERKEKRFNLILIKTD